MGKGFPFSVFLLFCLPLFVFPEGTRQIAPFSTAEGWVCLDKSRNDFGFFDAAPEFRINIYVANTTETINFGLGQNMYATTLVAVQYQVKDPAGNIVAGPAAVPWSGQGHISTYDQAIIGPFVAAGGYDPIQYVPAMQGNYSLEFYYPPDSSGYYTEVGRVQFEYFDITVVDAANKPVTGRVWSKAWQFNCGPVEAPPTESRFWGNMYILSDDSIVTSVNCNGFVGGTFSISSNKTGCSNSGNISVDRQSRTGFHTYPQYKIFLNDPDSTIFPTGKAQPGIIPPITINTNCNGTVDIGMKVNMDGLVEVFIEVNPKPGADPEDVKLTANVLANPGGNGYNIIRWNGKDGRGNLVKNGTTLTGTVRFIHGITHLPIYDIEYKDNGYKVQVIRPPGTSPSIYWDDSLIPGDSSTVDLTGCNVVSGCHLWSYGLGNVNTINSWWYVASATAPAISFTVKRTPLAPGPITGDPSVCKGMVTGEYKVVADSNASTYLWTYSGTGVVIAGNGPGVTVTFSDTASSGTLTVSGFNQDCGSGPASNLAITIFPLPQVTLGKFDSVCYNAPSFQLTGGTPPGGEFLINGLPVTMYDPVNAGPGSHTVVYKYTNSHGCSNYDSTNMFITNGHECDILIWIPDAFTPDGNGLNDVFRPVSQNISQFSMNIYNRAGQLLFTSGNVDDGWDGTCGGQPCPVGNYVYIVVYESSVAPPEFKTLSGNITLVR